ncbi:histidine phosphatase family protein [Opitutus sp. ER46]|uniref:SixA phosphatase family protein n=1 Tax=Opitutus sp. ER46 TaxID=2161864 RepID=UPI000D30AAE1|nr:histidine phosphatase family protein [Opitutus sp. ER46]PTX98613.1 hypothetical protein DB354_04940 [Opitutus sp. ER46]
MPDIVYLVRHADALDPLEDGDDASRRLSRTGHLQVRKLAELLRGGAFRPTAFWHSPLVRARETAEALARHLRLTPTWLEWPELAPDVDPQAMVGALRDARGSIAVVGHEPHLSCLATLLVTDAPRPTVFLIPKATVLALEPGGSRWAVRWQVTPELFH